MGQILSSEGYCQDEIKSVIFDIFNPASSPNIVYKWLQDNDGNA